MTETVTISSEPIELYKLLKLAGLASSGGEAKSAIADGLVTVNGEPEARKRKKLVVGDVVRYGDDELLIQLGQT